jgi:hypothetical protein
MRTQQLQLKDEQLQLADFTFTLSHSFRIQYREVPINRWKV